MAEVTAADVARRIDVPPATLRRWVRSGLVPLSDGAWSDAAIAQARIVARLRERGHPMRQIRAAADNGRLAYDCLEQLFPGASGPHSLDDAAERTGLEPALIQRMWSSLGFPAGSRQGFTDQDVELLEYAAAVLHEPLMRDGVPGLEMAEEMETLAAGLLPLAAPVMDGLHRRLLRHFVGQDVVGHLETDGDFDLGRLRVAIAFADLAGYTRLTEEAGEDQAVDVVERFVAGVEATLPDDARVIKTIGGEVLVRRPVMDAAGPHLRFDQIGEVTLKGFSEPTELFVAEAAA